MSIKQQLQTRKETVSSLGVFEGQKWETMLKKDSWRQQLEQFHLARLSKRKRLTWDSPSELCTQTSSINIVVIVHGDPSFIPQPGPSLPPFLCYRTSCRLPWESLFIFQRRMPKGAFTEASLGSECCLLKGSSICQGSTQKQAMGDENLD